MTNSSFQIKGNIGRKLFDKEDFKIYGFYPDNSCSHLVKVNDYGSITICGNLPNMIEDKEYILEVVYQKRGQYDNYIVQKILNKRENVSINETVIFLSEFVSKDTVQNIVDVYPDIIDRIVKGKVDTIDLSKIKGVGKKRFELIKEKIIANYNLFDIINEFHEYELTFAQVKKIYEKYTSIEVLRKKMNENPYKCLCSIAGIGFKTADAKILNKNASLAKSPFRMRECVLFALNENEESGNTWISIKELHKRCMELAGECMMNFLSVLKNSDDIYLNTEKKRVAKTLTFLCEFEIAKMLNELVKSDIKTSFDYKKYDNVDGLPLTDKQMTILNYANKYGVSVLSGYGGTGKSFSTKALITMLDDAKKTYMLISPTGKASKVLAQYTDRPASTIHRGLKYHPKEGFAFNASNTLDYDFLIIDEAGMIDAFLMRDLLRAVNPDTTRVIFVCDPAQIPSVGCGNCIQDIISCGIIPTIFLDEVFRYGEGGLSYVATKIREGEKFLEDRAGSQIFGKNKDFQFVNLSNDMVISTMMAIYKKMIANGIDKNDIMVISAYNKGEYGTLAINNMIQEYINPDVLGVQMGYVKDKVEVNFREGDRVMQIKNNYKAKVYDPMDVDDALSDLNDEPVEKSIFNGDEGIVYLIDEEKEILVVDFDGTLIEYNKSDITSLLLAYAVSAHKSQGSSFEHVIVVLPTSHTYFLNRNLLYVAVTRARQRVFGVGSVSTVNGALKKSENLSRQTFLKELLITKNKEN